MEPAPGVRIRITRNGPYFVSGFVPMTRESIACDSDGESEKWLVDERLADRGSAALCRCGRSGNKPMCDGSHSDGFDGTETASRVPYAERAEQIPGPRLTLHDVAALCAEARFCHRGGKAWHLVKSADEADVATVIEECGNCPSGRYVASDNETAETIEPALEPSIAFVHDVAQDTMGPIWVRGGIQIEPVEGEPYEVRNRVTLCRCGTSSNKPFCDGSHIGCDIHDHR